MSTKSLVPESLRVKEKTLSAIPSVRLRQAVDDAVALSRTRNFKLQMNWWCHVKNKTCTVCLAGASMVRRLNETDIDALGCGDVDKIYSIDSLREGCFSHLRLSRSKQKKLESLYERLKKIDKELWENEERLSWGSYYAIAELMESLGV